MAADDTKHRYDTRTADSEDEGRQPSEPSKPAPSPTLERLAPGHQEPELGARIIRLIDDEPFEEEVASLGLVLVCVLLSEADVPSEAFDGLVLRLRQALNEGLEGVEARPTGVR